MVMPSHVYLLCLLLTRLQSTTSEGSQMPFQCLCAEASMPLCVQAGDV